VQKNSLGRLYSHSGEKVGPFKRQLHYLPDLGDLAVQAAYLLESYIRSLLDLHSEDSRIPWRGQNAHHRKGLLVQAHLGTRLDLFFYELRKIDHETRPGAALDNDPVLVQDIHYGAHDHRTDAQPLQLASQLPSFPLELELLILYQPLLSFHAVLLLSQRQVSLLKLAHAVQDVAREIRTGL